MNDKDVLDGNKLIAEFMGIEPVKSTTGNYRFYEMVKDSTINENTEVFPLYHTSWDWLMPVVEKIGITGGHIDVMFFEGKAKVLAMKKLLNGKYEGLFISQYGENPAITATWFAVVEFIKWHNSQH